MVEASNVGSNWWAMPVITETRLSCLSPMTLIGNSEGYSISDSLRGSLPSPAAVSMEAEGGREDDAVMAETFKG
ncbi:hypothetical protein D3C85_1863230 [compost metagenome]